jgi:hypothetical protein
MAFVGTAAMVGGAIGLGGTAAIIGGGALIGAGVGGAYSAITGDGNVLNSMLTGGLIGGAGAYGIGALGGGGAGVQAQMAGPFWGSPASAPSTLTAPTSNVVSNVPALTGANTPAGAALANASADPIMSANAMQGMSNAEILSANKPIGTGISGMKALGYGLAGTTALSLLGGRQGKGAGQPPSPGMIRPYEYSSNPTEPTGVYPSPYATTVYDTAGNPVLDTRERNYFDQQYTALEPYKAAKGGIMQAFQAGGPVERMSMMNTAMNPQGGLYPQGMIDKTQYATPIQRPVSSELVMDAPAYERSNPMLMAHGGVADLGGYSDGGRMLKGPGDGMSDSIPASIGNRQPARLADGEFVVPADVVSHLGNGSTDAGAKRLYAMMDKVRKARTGSKKQGKQIKAQKYLPA